MKRVAAAIDERREDLAYTLALDQGKPKVAEAYDEVEELIAYFEMASADATRMDGVIPPRWTRASVSSCSGSPAAWSRSSALELAVHDAGEILAPSIATGTPWCGPRRQPPRSARSGSPSASRRPTYRPAS